MGAPVVHFELHGKDAAALQDFYKKAFDWHVDTNNPQDYGMVDTHTGSGINGAVTAGPNMDNGTIIYVEVDDMQAALDRVEELGGQTVMPITDMEMVTFALFRDPASNMVGLVKSEEQ